MIIKTYHIVTIDITQTIDSTLNLNFSFPILRAFTSAHAKVLVYFIIETFFFFFYFTYLLFKTPHIRLFNLHHISLKYQFFYCFSFFTHNTLSSFILEIHNEIIDNKIQNK